MATETGTASDYRDLLQKLKLFMTGESVSPIGSNGLSWVVEEERSQYTSPQTEIPQGNADELIEVTSRNDQSHDQIIFRGNGGTSPEKEIYFAIQTLGLSTTGYYNWQIRGLTGYAQASPITDYVPLVDQPGRSPPAYLNLQNTTMTYWFVANNRRVMGAVKTGVAYHGFYFGFLNPFATDAEYPYPLCICGTDYNENHVFSQNSVYISTFLNPGGTGGYDAIPQEDAFPDVSGSCWVRFQDGSWRVIKNHEGTNLETRNSFASSSEGAFAMYPFAANSTTNKSEGNVIDTAYSWALDWASTTPGGTPLYQMLPAFGSPGQTVMWPLTVYDPVFENFIGDLDGLYWVPGAGGITSEDTITDVGESPEVEHIIFQNVWRTDAWMYFGMRNE